MIRCDEECPLYNYGCSKFEYTADCVYKNKNYKSK